MISELNPATPIPSQIEDSSFDGLVLDVDHALMVHPDSVSTWLKGRLDELHGQVDQAFASGSPEKAVSTLHQITRHERVSQDISRRMILALDHDPHEGRLPFDVVKKVLQGLQTGRTESPGSSSLAN